MNKTKTKGLILISLFAALTAIGAFIKIPIPYVPIIYSFSLRIFRILLGARWGCILSYYIWLLD